MKYTFILLILFQTSLAFSQSEQLVRGDFYFEKQGYYQALNCFERVKESEFESAEMQQKLAFCYNFL